MQVFRVLKLRGALACLLAIGCLSGLTAKSVRAEEPAVLQVIVMDPLAAQLSCPCVEGYAQRDYEALAEHLRGALNCDVQVVFGETLAKALEQTGQRADLIIGKDSVVRSDAAGLKLKLTPIAALTDKQGVTTQHGLLVVRHDDAAQSVKDLTGHQVRFGPVECEEKHGAALALLKKEGIPVPQGALETDPSCTTGACQVVEQEGKPQVVAVISSYAAPLLEGCGTVKRGELRVIGKTEPVPFITAFLPENSTADSARLQQALLAVAQAPHITQKLESLFGFLEVKPDDETTKKKP